MEKDGQEEEAGFQHQPHFVCVCVCVCLLSVDARLRRRSHTFASAGKTFSSSFFFLPFYYVFLFIWYLFRLSVVVVVVVFVPISWVLSLSPLSSIFTFCGRRASSFHPSIHRPACYRTPAQKTRVWRHFQWLSFGYATCCANAHREELLELASVFFPRYARITTSPLAPASPSLFFFKREKRHKEREWGGHYSVLCVDPPPFSIQTLQLYTRNSRWHALWWVKPSKKDKIILGWNFELRWNLNVIIRCSFALLYSIPRNGIIFVLLIWIIIQ